MLSDNRKAGCAAEAKVLTTILPFSTQQRRRSSEDVDRQAREFISTLRCELRWIILSSNKQPRDFDGEWQLAGKEQRSKAQLISTAHSVPRFKRERAAL